MARGKQRRSVRANQNHNTDFEYDTPSPSVVRQYREKHASQSVIKQDKKSRREYMMNNPETLLVLEEFEDISLDSSGVLAAGSQLSMFYTRRVDEWVNMCRKIYKNSNLHVDEVSDANGTQLRMKRNKKDGDLLYALSFGKTGFVNVQGREHETWGEADFYTLHSLMTQNDSLSFTQDTDTQCSDSVSQSESLQSQSLFSPTNPSLSPVSLGSNSSIAITQSPTRMLTQPGQSGQSFRSVTPEDSQVSNDNEAQSSMSTTCGTQSVNLHSLDDTQSLAYPQSLCTPLPESISDSPSDSILVRAAADADTKAPSLPVTDDSDITVSSQLSQVDNCPTTSKQSTNNLPIQQPTSDDSVQELVSECSEPSEVLIPPIPPNAVTIEDVGDYPDDGHSLPNLEETIIDNRKPPNSCPKPASTPKRGHDVTLNATSAGSPIPTQSDTDTSKHSLRSPPGGGTAPGQSNPRTDSKKPPSQKNRLPDTSPILFKVKGDHPWLSNMYQDDKLTQFELCDYAKWKTREHCYQWRKAIFHEEWVLANAIISAPTSEEAKALGSQIVCKPEWHDKKKSVMKEIISGYCEQKNWFVEKLKATGSRPLCENTDDSDWGSLNGGSNWLGEILMDQRKDYLAQSNESSPSMSTNQPKANQNSTPQASCEQNKEGKPTASKRQKKVLLFGDSIPDKVPLDIPGMTCEVKSHSGARVTVPKTAGSDYVPSSTLLKNDMDGDEDYVGLLIGINDVAHTNVTKFKASYRMLVKTAKSKGAKVLCHQIFHRGDRRDLNAKVDTFNYAIFQVAMEEECACVNATSSYNSTAWKPNINMLAGGRLHLKPWAKRTVANRLSTVIRQIDSVVSSPPSTAPRHSPRRHSPRRHSPRRHSPRRHSPRRHSPRVHSRRPYHVNQTEVPEDARWDSCYRPTPGYYRQNPNNRWQQYPMSTGYQGAW